MKTLMNDWLVIAASLVVLNVSPGCDVESKEIGATVGEGTSGGEGQTETTGGAEGTSGGAEGTSGGVGESSGGAVPNCAAAGSADACDAVEGDFEFACVWVDVQTTDATCSADDDPVGRCIVSQYFGDGCIGTNSCVDDVSIFTREVPDGGFEWFSAGSPCGSSLPDYSECRYDGSDTAPCECLCQGLGGIGSRSCDPLLGPACPNSLGSSQECEPNPQNDGWACAPQSAGTSPVYGDECWPEDSPGVACTGDTICLPAEGLGVAGCDGGEGMGCCTQLCSLAMSGDDSCPDEGQECTPFYGEAEAPEGYEDIGVCRLP